MSSAFFEKFHKNQNIVLPSKHKCCCFYLINQQVRLKNRENNEVTINKFLRNISSLLLFHEDFFFIVLLNKYNLMIYTVTLEIMVR